MNFKRELLDKIKLREKTQTRRPYHPEDCAIDIQGNPGSPDSPYFNQLGEIQCVVANGRTRYEVGKVYAVCPGRGKKQECKMRLTKIRYEDVRQISIEDSIAEGFKDQWGFFYVWTSFYDQKAKDDVLIYTDRLEYLHSSLQERPTQLYQAWALTFELV